MAHDRQLTKPVPLPVLPQLVPSQVCFRCDVCCRFPERDSFLRPYFTAEEIARAVSAGVRETHFPDPQGCQVSVVPNPLAEGYVCPAFDPLTSRCTIHAVRPLDCQIYPLALMWNEAHNEVLLGWDSKCPFLGPGEEHEARGEDDDVSPHSPHPSPEALEAYVVRVADIVGREETLDIIARHPRLVGPFQEDVVVLRALPSLTRRLTIPDSSQPSALTPLRLENRLMFETACATLETPLGAYAFAWHFIWRELFTYFYAEMEGHFCLFAEYGDGIFMPLPPLPATSTQASRRTPQDFARSVTRCFDLMRERNQGSAVSRIENVAAGQKPVFETLGFRAREKDSDYLYRTADLVALAGDRYKSQRAAVNRFRHLSHVRVEGYVDAHREACLNLFHVWAEQKHARGLDATASQMLRDSASAHRQALTYHRELGLRGTVLWVGEVIRAYTFGYDRSPRVYCVLLEVADRALYGLAQFLFQETCREAQRRDIEYVNALDDSGLPELAKTKLAYHPVELVTSFVVTAT